MQRKKANDLLFFAKTRLMGLDHTKQTANFISEYRRQSRRTVRQSLRDQPRFSGGLLVRHRLAARCWRELERIWLCSAKTPISPSLYIQNRLS